MTDHAVEQSYERGAHHEPHGGVGIYVTVAVALVFLTACSYWTYTPLWPFGENLAIKRLWMMAVSCTKAMLVILFFMHLKWEANWKWVLTVPASIMSMLLIFALVPDVGLRYVETTFAGPSHNRLTYAADPGESGYAAKHAASGGEAAPHAEH
jgi:cytochrome c oxidase subunit 4